MQKFSAELLSVLFNSQFLEYDDNYDFFRFGQKESLGFRKKLDVQIGKILKKIKLYARRYLHRPNYGILEQWLGFLPQLEWLYSKLEDSESKELLVKIIAYRIMGFKAVKLPLNTPDYWQKLDYYSEIQQHSDSIDIGFMGWKLYLTDLTKVDLPIKMYTLPLGIMMLKLQQYSCPRANIQLNKGDVVFDCGGCYGDTALDFAYQVGEKGKVYTFEFIESNLKILRKNVDLNSNLHDQIEIIQHPLWNSSDITMFIDDNGPASRVSLSPFHDDKSPSSILTISIDDVVDQRRLERVDLIKMDIEGAEFESLKGAEKTICKFKPNLAISIYHRPEHFFQIAQFIDDLNLGYHFYLGHFTIHQEETVLFAKAL